MSSKIENKAELKQHEITLAEVLNELKQVEFEYTNHKNDLRLLNLKIKEINRMSKDTMNHKSLDRTTKKIKKPISTTKLPDFSKTVIHKQSK